MADRENVIKGLREMSCRATWKDIDRIRHKFQPIINDALALMKEKDAVRPEREGSGVTWWNVCGNCRTAINPNDKYCHECGRAVKWE